jgi:hypothetical protein
MEQAVLRCASCGAPLHDGARACAFCGAALAQPLPPVAAAAPQSEAIEALRSWIARLPNVVELQFGYTGAEQCAKFSQTFGGRVAALANQILNASAHRLQVNYVQAAAPPDGSAIFAGLVRLSGKSNAIARKAHVVIEVISPDAHAVAAVLDVLRPDEVHKPHHHWL